MHRLSMAMLGAAICVGLVANVSSAKAQGVLRGAARVLEETGATAKATTALEDAARAGGWLGTDLNKPATELSPTIKYFGDHARSEAAPSGLCGAAGLSTGYYSDSTTTGLGTYGACRGSVHLFEDHGLTFGQH